MTPAFQWRALPRPRFGLKALLLVITALGIYFSAYRALMRPIVVVDVGHLGFVIEGSREPHYGSLDRNGALNSIGRIAFAPIEYFDYLSRPKYWDEYSEWPE